MPSNPNKQKRKAYYRKCAAHSKRLRVDGKIDLHSSVVPKNLQPGMVGYLVTCNRHERLALMEIFRLLNGALKQVLSVPENSCQDDVNKKSLSSGSGVIDAAESSTPEQLSIEPPSAALNDKNSNNNGEEVDDDDDVLKRLRSENAPTEAGSVTTSAIRYNFHAIRSGVSNCLFVLHYAQPCPNVLVNSIFENVLHTRVIESRHVLRVLPVAATCHASSAELMRCVRILWTAFIDQMDLSINREWTPQGSKDETLRSDSMTISDPSHLDEKKTITSSCIHNLCSYVDLPRARPDTLNGPKTFLVAFKARNYDRLSRDTAIETVVSAIRGIDSSWRICPTTPSVTIFVNVLRNVACISLLEDFGRFRKYNLAEMISPTSNAPPVSVSSTTKNE
ncbi:hypothetical protein FBUS_07571 [Fasciolopsis buskii]|uniref:THUMP domain-containing protein n=1 Tax=Fasciolopsis buskii TaxID=27845 RepID=A0A8E0VFR0_9TREM|nr:hypothetical protein FBUS_07571 [Fasciolopsis buski]